MPPELASFVDRPRVGRRADRRLPLRAGGTLLRSGAADLAAAGTTAYAAENLSVAASAADVHVVVTGGAGVKMQLLPGWMGGTRSVTAQVQPL